jgi:MFS family permease
MSPQDHPTQSRSGPLRATAGQKKGKVFYGWWIALVTGIGLFLHYGPMIAFTFGVFLKPLSQEFGWSRTDISLAFALANLAASGALPLVGLLVDRWGARKVIVPSLLLFGTGIVSFAFLSAHLWHLYALYLVIGIVAGGTTPVPYAKVISCWFDKQRGLALGLAGAGTSVGAFIMPSLAQACIAAVGWRHAYVFLGLLVIVIASPVVGLFLKETPQMLGLWPDGETGAPTGAAIRHGPEPGMSGREAWHTGTFWFMTSAFFLVSVSLHGCILHLVPLLTDRGVSV